MGVIHPDICKAETLPSNYYTDEHIYLELLQKFHSSWNFIGLESMLEENSIVPISIGGTPMLLTKTDSQIYCVSNVCTHRGMILCQENKTTSTITCPYHGRTFSLNGEIKHMPKFSEVENFPADSDNLPSAKVVNWHGLLFANLSDDESFEGYMDSLESRMNFLDFSKLNRDSGLDRLHELSANWMLYVDNYLEGFHIPYVHKGLNSVIDYSNYETEVFDNAVLQIGYALEGEESFDIPLNHQDYGKNIAAYYWWVFPNLMLNFYPWGLSINVVIPNGVSSTKIAYYGLISDDSKLGTGAGGNLDTVEDEDQWIVESCNKGMNSPLYQRGRYSPSMEQGVHHFHRLLTE
ncbi:MAG: aromatic ring-hydroxylating dioxygenase subunit alpha [Candidatus Thermoplasmatota archaeon]|nr:aromatic ring-hydroxylating dioxygenase subunit alpha [Candidatus Thermoplasmatota archaeon]